MKKLLLAMSMLLGVMTSAQELKFGVKAGLNIASITGDYTDYASEINPRFGLHLGGFMEYKFTEKLAFQPELLFSMQGNKYSVKETYFENNTLALEVLTQTNKLHYINLPLLLKYYATPRLSFELGPQLGYMIGGKAKLEYQNAAMFLYDSVEIDLIDDGFYNFMGESFYFDPLTNRFELGFVLGASYAISNSVAVQGRYHLGITSIEDTEFKDEETRNGVFQFSIGYAF